MNSSLEQFAAELPADAHAVMVLDRAGSHTANALVVPPNVTMAMLPPKSPELNPTENLWHYLRSHHWSNRLFETCEDLKTAAAEPWRKVCLNAEKIETMCADGAARQLSGSRIMAVL